jgi:hypothetical protein
VTVRIAWSDACNRDVLAMHWLDAQSVCQAVDDYARDGSGRIERVDPEDPLRVRVHAEGGYAVVWILADGIQVRRIFATEPLARAPQLLDKPDPPPKD